MRLTALSACVLLATATVHAQGWPPRNGSSLPATCASGESFFLSTSTALGIYRCTATDTWTLLEPATESTGGLPSGAIVFIDSGTCPTGYTEVAALNGRMARGTVNANGDVGGTGGSDSVTPTFAGTPFSSVINHTHTVTVTDPGHTHTLPVGATDDTAAPFDRADAGTNASGANATTASGSTATGITATTANPAGGVTSITPAGTISAVDTRAAYLNLIGCKKD